MPTKKEIEDFFKLYWDVRSIIINFQIESPRGPVYASGAIEKIRNALDDYVDGWLNNNSEKIANAQEHLSIAGNESLEIILLGKIKNLDKIGKKLNNRFWKFFYPRKIFNYIYSKTPSIEQNMITGKTLKSSDYYGAKNAFMNGIKEADEILDKYNKWEITGMKKAEHRLNIFWGAVITIIGSIITTLVVTIILKILEVI